MFGSMHRLACLPDQLVDRHARLVQGDTDAGGNLQVQALDDKFRLHGGGQLGGNDLRAVRRGKVFKQQDELVTAQPAS
ncbi:MAG: hypothetical protein NDI70_00045 [Pseudomonas sagittaria]|nr:hypothetical protein [Pseudomonas sagittaria]MCM2329665.1 hypothetical protein [Pseudomonas sagittaria]